MNSFYILPQVIDFYSAPALYIEQTCNTCDQFLKKIIIKLDWV